LGNPVAQLDFLMKNKKCHLTRWFEIRLWNFKIIKIHFSV
jgi:hypothetical protein